MKRSNQDYNGVSESFMNQFECCPSVGLSSACATVVKFITFYPCSFCHSTASLLGS